MALLLKPEFPDQYEVWHAALTAADPNLKILDWPYKGDPGAVEVALVWAPPAGELALYRRLKLVISIGAGVDHVLGDPDLPEDVPILRMVEPGLTTGMAEYVVWAVLSHHRFMLDYAQMRKDKRWEMILQVPPEKRSVGIMGLGVLGRAAIEEMLVLMAPLADRFHFLLSLWEITSKDPEVVRIYERQLAETAALIESAKAEGSIAKDLSTTWVVTALDALIYSSWWMVSEGHASAEEAAALVARTFFGGVGPKP